MKMLNALFAATLVAGLVGCNAGKEQADQFDALSAKMCACADMDCAKKADTELMEWVGKNKGLKVSQTNFDRIKAAASKAVECGKKHGDADAEKIDDTLPQAE